MATVRTWTIKGVSDRTREATLEAAHEAGLTVGAWLDQVLAAAAEEAVLGIEVVGDLLQA